MRSRTGNSARRLTPGDANRGASNRLDTSPSYRRRTVQSIRKIVGIPLVLAVLAFGGLHALCKRGSTIGERAAVIAFATLFVFTILAGFSIGILVLPITALVGAALVLTPEP